MSMIYFVNVQKLHESFKIYRAYFKFNNVPMVVGVMYGIKPAVVAIVLCAAWRIGSHTLQNQWRIGIAAAAFLAITLLHVPFPIIVLSAACLGCIGAYITPDILKMKEGHAAVSASNAAFIIDDHTPTPDHARYSLRKLIVISVAGICLGLAPCLVLTMHYGASSTFPQMSTFFTKAAFLTFGGAYAVLPYVYQGAVEHYHWLTPSKMMDGLALGETTPGPLIMIVTFVGFVGGWTKMATLTAGIMGACVATYFTFLPSFIFILAGGPMVESTRDNLRLTFQLTTISAAVVGVILSLVVFFAKHIFNLTAPISQWDWIAIAATAAACVALFKFKLQPIKLILISAVIGLVVSYLR